MDETTPHNDSHIVSVMYLNLRFFTGMNRFLTWAVAAVEFVKTLRLN